SMIGLTRVFADGAAGLDDYAKRARDLGLIVDRDIIARSEAMANQLGVASKVVDTELKTAFIEVVPFIVRAAQATAAVTREINRFIDAGRAVGDQQTRFMQQR